MRASTSRPDPHDCAERRGPRRTHRAVSHAQITRMKGRVVPLAGRGGLRAARASAPGAPRTAFPWHGARGAAVRSVQGSCYALHSPMTRSIPHQTPSASRALSTRAPWCSPRPPPPQWRHHARTAACLRPVNALRRCADARWLGMDRKKALDKVLFAGASRYVCRPIQLHRMYSAHGRGALGRRRGARSSQRCTRRGGAGRCVVAVHAPEPEQASATPQPPQPQGRRARSAMPPMPHRHVLTQDQAGAAGGAPRPQSSPCLSRATTTVMSSM